MLTKDTFVDLLRDNLNHLYDTDYLRQSPLGQGFGIANRSDTASALREILVEAVESLKPAEGVPSQSRDWRLYDALFYAYVQQLDQRIVADQLGLSVRHLRREQRAALDILADRLWERVNIDTEAGQDINEMASETSGATVLSEELAWLKDLPADRPTDLAETLAGAIDLVSPLAEQNGVRIETIGIDAVPRLAVHPVALNQTLLNLLSLSVSLSEMKTVTVDARAREWSVDIIIKGIAPNLEMLSLPEDELTSLQMAGELAAMSGGDLEWFDRQTGFEILLTLPALNQLAVLAVDDNPDTLQLMERYTAGTKYRLIGCQNPDKILSLVESTSPQLIVLDVMMPQVDGWNVLGTLRQHPLTKDIPIVVCTVLTQEKLARSLGAADYLRKPFARGELLTTLDRQIPGASSLSSAR
jgi:CheY-like chemotaxis protein